MEKYLKIGIIQTNLNKKVAWEKSINMSPIAEEKAWYDIKKGLCNITNDSNSPDIILLPELTLPIGYINQLKNIAKAISSVIITGIDFYEFGQKKVRNRAIIIVPSEWPKKRKSSFVSSFYIGKTFFSNDELNLFKVHEYHKYSEPVNCIFNGGDFGNFGIAICADFFDIERFVLYRGRIHHLLILAYNQDTDSFYFLAEAISRLIYCNVVICNTGFYGNSMAFSPYKESFKRIIYRHEGQNIFTTQVIKLPVSDMEDAQNNNDKNELFKSIPPCYQKIKWN